MSPQQQADAFAEVAMTTEAFEKIAAKAGLTAAEARATISAVAMKMRHAAGYLDDKAEAA